MMMRTHLTDGLNYITIQTFFENISIMMEQGQDVHWIC